MSRLQLVILLTSLASGARGDLLTGDSGYQYDRPGFGGDFPRRTGSADLGNLGRFPGRPIAYYRPADNFGSYNRQADGFRARYQGYQGNQGFQGLQGSGQGYQSFQVDDRGGNERPRAYSFEYEVRDPATNNDYGQRESGDGNGSVRGEYRVLLPDSRTQIVRYTANDANGYVADVRYEGQVQQPQFGRPGFFPSGPNGPGFFDGRVAGYQPGRGGYNGGPGDEFGGGGGSNQYLPPGGGGSFGK